MPRHDEQTDAVPIDNTLNDAQAERVEGIAQILAEHLYAQPQDDDVGDNSNWSQTSEANKRIFRSCALEVDRFYRG